MEDELLGDQNTVSLLSTCNNLFPAITSITETYWSTSSITELFFTGHKWLAPLLHNAPAFQALRSVTLNCGARARGPNMQEVKRLVDAGLPALQDLHVSHPAVLSPELTSMGDASVQHTLLTQTSGRLHLHIEHMSSRAMRGLQWLSQVSYSGDPQAQSVEVRLFRRL
jgi:hypothetical protein